MNKNWLKIYIKKTKSTKINILRIIEMKKKLRTWGRIN